MRRPNRYCLVRQNIMMSWNSKNCFNIVQRRPLVERNLNLFQLEWKSKAPCRLYFNGDVSERSFKKIYNENRRDIYDTLAFMERRMENVLFRSMFSESVFAARKLVSSGQVLLNGSIVRNPSHSLQDGDIIQVSPDAYRRVHAASAHPMIRYWAFTPAYLEVSFTSMAAVFLRKPRFEEIPNPYPRFMIENMGSFYSKRG